MALLVAMTPLASLPHSCSQQNVFVQLSLAFRNDSYTLESRINQAERERNLTEENTEKELENFKASITVTETAPFKQFLQSHCL